MADTDPAYRLAALQALATGGSQAKAAVDQARTDMQASQTAALKQAAANSAAYGLGQEGTDTLSAPISGAYNNRISTLDKVSAPSLARFNTVSAPTGALFEKRSAAIQAKQAGSGGGGRGGGSGGSGGGSKLEKWFTTDLQNEYDTKENLYSSIYQQASDTKTGQPSYVNARQLATQYGIPGGAATAQFKPSAKFTQFANTINASVREGVTLQQAQQALRKSGLSSADRDYLYNQYVAAQQTAKKKKK